MQRSLSLSSDAKADLQHAYSYYESERSGLGTQFLDSVSSRFDSISDFPESFPIVYQDVRESLVKRFPFAIYFIPEADSVVVVAVYHSSRDPSAWQKRLHF